MKMEQRQRGEEALARPAPARDRSDTHAAGMADGSRVPVDRRASAAAQRRLGDLADRSSRLAGRDELLAHLANRDGTLPVQLKAGVEALSGVSMDNVKVHYRSALPARLHARALAQGDDIHLGPGQESLLAHEAWHVAQQRQGRVRPHGPLAGINDDAGLESEADVMGARAMAHSMEAAGGGAPEPVRQATGSTAARIVQRKIAFGTEPLDYSWNQVRELTRQDLDKAIEAARTLCTGLDEKQFGDSWNRLKSTTRRTFDLADAQAFAEAIMASHKRAERSSATCIANNGVSKALVAPLVDAAGGELKFVGGARPKLLPKSAHVHDYDSHMEKERQSQRHLSTIYFEEHKEKGEEIQSSFARDGSAVYIASNSNRVNDTLRGQATSVAALKARAVEVAKARNLATVSRETAMRDRVLRHAMKFYSRVDGYLAKDCRVTVPGDAAFDGRHAEIRITQAGNGEWTVKKFFLPAGVKLPCLGCSLHFSKAGMFLGVRVGPLWVTAAAISSQIEAETGAVAKLSSLTPAQIKNIAEEIARQFRKAREAQGAGLEIGQSKCRDGGGTIAHDPDSESDLDEQEFTRVKTQMVPRSQANAAGRHAVLATVPRAAPPVSSTAPSVEKKKRRASRAAEEYASVPPTSKTAKNLSKMSPSASVAVADESSDESEDEEETSGEDTRMSGTGSRSDSDDEGPRAAAFDPSIRRRRGHL